MDRRTFTTAALAAAAAPAAAQAQAPKPPLDLLPKPRPSAPDAAELRSGDFLWPKPAGSFVVYRPASAASDAGPLPGPPLEMDPERLLWETQQAAFLQDARPSSPADAAAVSRLRDLRYETFRQDYSGDRQAFYVGHVAIVDLSADQPMVIEATPPRVIRRPYADWVAEHARDQVFHGRCKAGDDAGRARIATEALRHLDVKYDFFDLDLASARGFYCSKLAWLATLKALDVALDGQREARRWLWFSPKQMFYCDTIEHLNSSGKPGDYAPA